MKALTTRQKEFLYRELVYGKFRIIAKPCYDAILGAILLGNRLRDLFYKKDQSDISDLTILIKTFERRRAVRRLVRSIRRRYPQASIVVVDDSREPKPIDGVTTILLPYDSGASAGRNAALDQIRTKYFLLLDDDFVFSRRQHLGLLIQQMEKYPEIDILGGRYIDLPFYIKHDFQEIPVHSSEQPKAPLNTYFGDNRVVDKVQNYFIARTNVVREIRWNETLKTLEHTEFFVRAKGQATTAFRTDMFILHAKTPFDREYLRKRYRYGGATASTE